MTAKILSLPGPIPSPEATASTVDATLRRRVYAGLVVVGLLVFGLGGWAALAKLSGAVIAPGMVVVDSNTKRVQHPTGGVVGELRVKNGDRVRAGDVVVRLDDTQTRAQLGIVVSQLIELGGRKARLEAEVSGASSAEFPETLRSLGPDAANVMAGERRLFEVRRQQREAQVSQLNERIGQLRSEIEGLDAQIASKAEELALIKKEADRVADMYQRQLIPETRMLSIERDRTRIAGEHGALLAQIARSRGQINEIGIQIIGIEQTMRSDGQKDLREIEGKLAELAERRVAAEDQLKRIEIRAPLDGVVHELAVHTVGGVIQAGETIMLVVPSGELLTIEVRVPPTDIDQVTQGQSARLRFPAFNQRTTPEIPATVTRIAADLSREPQSGATYYVARIAADEAALKALKGVKLVPGMPVEAFIQTGERTALSYILKPLSDQFARALREE